MVSLEHLADGSVSDRNFLKLAALVLDTGGQSLGIRFGVATLTFTGTTESAGVTVTHGLGKVPANIQLSIKTAPAAGNRPIMSPGTPNDTAFAVAGEVKTAFTGTVDFYWVVLG